MEGKKSFHFQSEEKDFMKLLTNDDSVALTVMDVDVDPIAEALAFPMAGMTHWSPAAAQISALSFDVILVL